MTLTYDFGINQTYMKLSPFLHFLTAATMKTFLALTFLAALSLAVSSVQFISFSFKYHKGLRQYFQSNFQNRNLCSYCSMPP